MTCQLMFSELIGPFKMVLGFAACVGLDPPWTLNTDSARWVLLSTVNDLDLSLGLSCSQLLSTPQPVAQRSPAALCLSRLSTHFKRCNWILCFSLITPQNHSTPMAKSPSHLAHFPLCGPLHFHIVMSQAIHLKFLCLVESSTTNNVMMSQSSVVDDQTGMMSSYYRICEVAILSTICRPTS